MSYYNPYPNMISYYAPYDGDIEFYGKIKTLY